MQDEMDNGSNSHLNDSAWEYKGAHNIRLELQKLPDAFTYLQQCVPPNNNQTFSLRINNAPVKSKIVHPLS